MAFGTYVWTTLGPTAGAEWFACYFLEYSLSVDNLFVFILIFKYFKVDAPLQSRVLNFGVIGAVVLRFLFVYLGAELLERFNFLILFFAAILLYSSYTGLTAGEEEEDEEEDLADNFVVRSVGKLVKVSPAMDGDRFFTEAAGGLVATPLFLCLLCIEFSDIVFATDSVPAVLGTTQNGFVAYSSNLFAVFGLRSLYFLLRDAITAFDYLESAVNLVLGFIGAKILLDFTGLVEVPAFVSLFIVAGTLLAGVLLSLASPAKEEEELPEVAADRT